MVIKRAKQKGISFGCTYAACYVSPLPFLNRHHMSMTSLTNYGTIRL